MPPSKALQRTRPERRPIEVCLWLLGRSFLARLERGNRLSPLPSSRLAKSVPHGFHIPFDVFYSFPGNPINLTPTESRAQNTAIIRALGASSAVFLTAGYDVFLDGIVGPSGHREPGSRCGSSNRTRATLERGVSVVSMRGSAAIRPSPESDTDSGWTSGEPTSAPIENEAQ